jgi:pimeloyl-ACP methyl ester carboxylesterase
MRVASRTIGALGLASAALGTPPLGAQQATHTYVIVHGAWGGAWDWKTVDSMLTASGNHVYRATLTGLGERVHLATPATDLSTHITDVENLIRYENLRDVVLVGHSYGGMVITGVADRVPDRIRRLVYVDAFLPDSGESVVTLARSSRGVRALVDSAKNGRIVPPWVPAGTPPPTDVPQPVRTFTEQLILTNPMGRRVPGTYILTVDPGKAEADDDFYPSAQRAKARGFTSYVVPSDHVVERTAPGALTELLRRTP